MIFDANVDPELRKQILTYYVSGVMTDTERARLLELPEGCRIREGAKILAREKLVMGKYTWIGEGTILDAQGGLSIGDYTQISSYVMIFTHTTQQQALNGKTGTREYMEYKPTKIGNCCFIGGASIITHGVTIGDRVFISPCSVVTRDLPDDAVFNPHRDRYRAEKRIAKLENSLTRLVELLSTDIEDSVRRQEMKKILDEVKG